MSTPADGVYFAPLRTPVVDANGIMTRPWYLFFQALFLRSGGSGGTVDPSLEQGGPLSPGVAELSATLMQSVQAEQVVQLMQQVLDQVAELRKDIQDIKQGPIL